MSINLPHGFSTRDQLAEFLHYGYRRIRHEVNAEVIAAATRPIIDPALTAAALATTLEDVIRAALGKHAKITLLLSGGIDSALLAALATRYAQVTTLTVGFPETAFDETAAARAIAQHLHTEHYEITLNAATAFKLLPQLPKIYAPPLGDSSQLPTLWACQTAAKFAQPLFSGDGADEFFGGYRRYLLGDYFWRYWRYMPRPLRRAAQVMAQKIPPRFINDQFRRLIAGLAAPHFAEFYQQLGGTNGAPLIREGKLPPPPRYENPSFTAQAMADDQHYYLPNDAGYKTARAAQAVGLTLHTPFTAEPIINFAARLPLSQKIRGLRAHDNKVILREVLAHYLPRHLISRRKRGFGVPLGAWLRDNAEWKNWATTRLNSLINSPVLKDVFNGSQLQKIWQEHQRGAIDHSAILWHVLWLMADEG